MATKKKPVVDVHTRPITAVFYSNYQATPASVVRINRGLHPEAISLRCQAHLRAGRYTDAEGRTAVIAEITNAVTGELHAVLKRHVNGDITTMYKTEYQPDKPVVLKNIKVGEV